jgi:hypothetical protein
MLTLAWVALVYVATVAFWQLVAVVRERPGNYHAFCELLGLCALWPITLALEVALRLIARRERRRRAERDRKARQATPEV